VPRAARHDLVVAAAALLAACSSPRKLAKELDSVRSWTATAQLAAADRRAGSTNRALTAQLRDRANDALVSARAMLPSAAGTTAERASARTAVDSLAAAIHLLDLAESSR
jgi:hypothetical protein